MGWSPHLQCGYSDRFESDILHQRIRSQSVHGRTLACHAKRRGSLPLGTASICGYSSEIEQDAFNIEVAGLIPAARTSICTVRLSGRSPPFQGGKMGSIPIRCAKFYAGVLLGEDLAFQAKEEGSNPFARSNLSRVRIAAIAAASKSAG